MLHGVLYNSKIFFCIKITKRYVREFSYRLELTYQITPQACMESMQSIVWNPLQDGMELIAEQSHGIEPQKMHLR